MEKTAFEPISALGVAFKAALPYIAPAAVATTGYLAGKSVGAHWAKKTLNEAHLKQLTRSSAHKNLAIMGIPAAFIAARLLTRSAYEKPLERSRQALGAQHQALKQLSKRNEDLSTQNRRLRDVVMYSANNP